jgi:hypothetical protein
LKNDRGSISPFGIGITSIAVATALVVYLGGVMLIAQHRLQADLDLALLQAHQHSVTEIEHAEYSVVRQRLQQYFQANQTLGISSIDLEVEDFESRVRACSNLSLPFAALNFSTSVAICAESAVASFDPRDGQRVQS